MFANDKNFCIAHDGAKHVTVKHIQIINLKLIANFIRHNLYTKHWNFIKIFCLE